MTDFLYHALGICGEHWHPNLINVSLLAMITYGTVKGVSLRFSNQRNKQ